MKSPIREWDANAMEYGTAAFLYRIRKGSDKAIIVISEWVGPLCARNLRMRSMSGMIEAVSRSGMFSWMWSFVAAAFAVR